MYYSAPFLPAAAHYRAQAAGPDKLLPASPQFTDLPARQTPAQEPRPPEAPQSAPGAGPPRAPQLLPR